jgi:hypothetical protein
MTHGRVRIAASLAFAAVLALSLGASPCFAALDLGSTLSGTPLQDASRLVSPTQPSTSLPDTTTPPLVGGAVGDVVGLVNSGIQNSGVPSGSKAPAPSSPSGTTQTGASPPTTAPRPTQPSPSRSPAQPGATGGGSSTPTGSPRGGPVGSTGARHPARRTTSRPDRRSAPGARPGTHGARGGRGDRSTPPDARDGGPDNGRLDAASVIARRAVPFGDLRYQVAQQTSFSRLAKPIPAPAETAPTAFAGRDNNGFDATWAIQLLGVMALVGLAGFARAAPSLIIGARGAAQRAAARLRRRPTRSRSGAAGRERRRLGLTSD